MLDRIEPRGKLIHGCSLPGETRADRIAPAHPNGLQLSRNRFLLLNATLAFRGVDDSHSTVYQLRAGSWTGPVLAEGFLVQSIMDWDPFGTGVNWKRETGAPIGFGVPKGALVDGRQVPHENLFVVKWRTCARPYEPGEPWVYWWTNDREEIRRSHMVGWAQLRLNDAEDDIEILETREQIRQVGFEAGEYLCEQPVRHLNQSFSAIWPLSADHSEWLDVNHASWQSDTSSLFMLRYRFNADRGLYEWVQTSEPVGRGLYEANVVPWRGDWLIVGRFHGHGDDNRGGVQYARMHDPFAGDPDWIVRRDIGTKNAPITAYACPDGAVRVITGDWVRSPYSPGTYRWRDNRNPLFCFDVDPDAPGSRAFEMTACHTVFDTRAAALPISDDHGPVADMGKLLPHLGGREQTLVLRVRSCALDVWEPGIEERFNMRQFKQTAGDFDSTGIYHATLHYRDEHPPMWRFA